jgi:hypothetical protein
VVSEVNAVAFGGNATEMVELIPALLPRYGRHPWLMMALAAACARTGLTDRADAVFLELRARSQIEYVQPAVLAATAEWAGRRDEALAFLKHAVEIGDPMLGAFARYSPPMSRLRSAPEFWDIVSGLGRKTTATHPRSATSRSTDPVPTRTSGSSTSQAR